MIEEKFYATSELKNFYLRVLEVKSVLVSKKYSRAFNLIFYTLRHFFFFSYKYCQNN